MLDNRLGDMIAKLQVNIPAMHCYKGKQWLVTYMKHMETHHQARRYLLDDVIGHEFTSDLNVFLDLNRREH